MVLLKYKESEIVKTMAIYFSLYDVYYEGYYIHHINNGELKHDLTNFINDQRIYKIMQKTIRIWIIDVIYTLFINLRKHEILSLFCKDISYNKNLEVHLVLIMKQIGCRNENISYELKLDFETRNRFIEIQYDDKGEILVSPELIKLLNVYKITPFYCKYYEIIRTLFFYFFEHNGFAYILNIEKSKSVAKKTYLQYEKNEEHDIFVQKYHEHTNIL